MTDYLFRARELANNIRETNGISAKLARRAQASAWIMAVVTFLAAFALGWVTAPATIDGTAAAAVCRGPEVNR